MIRTVGAAVPAAGAGAVAGASVRPPPQPAIARTDEQEARGPTVS